MKKVTKKCVGEREREWWNNAADLVITWEKKSWIYLNFKETIFKKETNISHVMITIKFLIPQLWNQGPFTEDYIYIYIGERYIL